jgi:transcriptional accessory protein Tex/SPT6
LGLEQAAIDVLAGRMSQVNVDQFVDPAKDGLKNRNEVIEGIQNIMADAFAKDEDMLTYLSQMLVSLRINPG